MMVRIRPYDSVMTVLPLVWNGDTETAEISAATTYDNQLRWGVITPALPVAPCLRSVIRYVSCSSFRCSSGAAAGTVRTTGTSPVRLRAAGDPAAEGGCRESGM